MLAFVFVLATAAATGWTVINFFLWYRSRSALRLEEQSRYCRLLTRKWIRFAPLFLLVCIILLVFGVNLLLRTNGYYYDGSVASPEAKRQLYSLVKRKFAGDDGKFDYARFEKFLSEEFESLDKGVPSSHTPTPDEPLFPGYVMFLESLPTEQITNILPVLRKHTSSNEYPAYFGVREGIWPFRPIVGTGIITLGHVCTEVLRVQEAQ